MNKAELIEKMAKEAKIPKAAAGRALKKQVEDATTVAEVEAVVDNRQE